MPRILESDAIALARNIDSMPENQRPQAASILQAYKEQQEADGLPHWPQLMADQERETKRFRSMFESLSNVDGAAPAIAPVVKYAADPDEHRARVASTAFLATRYGKPADEISNGFELYAADYAAKNWNESKPLDSKGFYARAKTEIQGEIDREDLTNSLGEAVTKAALLNDKTAWQAWKDSAVTHPGWKPEREGQLFDAWRAADAKIKADMGENAALIRRTVESLQSKTGVEGNAAEWTRPEYDLRELLINDPAGYKKTLRLIGRVATVAAKDNKEGVLGWFQKAGESLARGVEGIGEGFVADAQRGASAVAGAVGAEDTAKLNDASVRVARDLRDIANGVVDPVKRNNWLDTMIFGGLESTPGMVAGMTGPLNAALLMKGQYAGDAEKHFEEQGWTGAESKAAAQVIGVAAAAVESWSEMFGATKWGRAAMQAIGAGPDAKFATRYFINSTLRGASEFSEEVVQDNLAAATQSMLNAVGASVGAPAPFMEEVSGWVKTQGADTAIVVLPLALLGAGLTTSREIGEAKANALLGDVSQTAKLIGREAADRIAAISDPQARAAEFQKVYQSQSAANRQEWLAASSELEKAKAEFAAATNTEAEAQALSITHDESGWRLNMADGGTVRVDSAQAAVSLRSDLMQARTEDEARALVSVVEDWQKSAPAGTMRETNFTGEQVRLGSDGQLIGERAGGDVRVIDSPKLLQDIRSQAQSTGLGAEVDLVVNGSNHVFAQSVNEASRQIVQRLEINRSNEQAPIITVLHEQLEANLKAANLGGVVSAQETMSALARVADALPVADAQQRLASLERRKAPQSHIEEARRELDLRQRIQSIANGEGDEAAMREIAVELAVADVIARDKSGMKTGLRAGAVSAALDSAISKAVTPGEVRALGKFRAFLRSVRAWVRSVLGTVAGFQKARRDGKLTDGDAWNAWLDKVTGVTEQARYDQELADELKAIAGQDETQYGGPSEGMAFSLSRAVPADSSNVVEMPDGARLVGPTTFSITAYHGTPHKVDRFRMDKLLTGEGNNAYGSGLYFAESRDVGEMYRDTVTSAKRERLPKLQEKLAFWNQFITDAPEGSQTPEQWRNDRAKAESEISKISQQIAILENAGNLYTVELLPDESDFLDWDKPLSEQGEKVKVAFLKAMKEGAMHNPFESATPMSGREGYNWFSAIFGQGEDSQKSASEYMAELGIPGIKYLDGGSRGAGDGTRNYVIFDDKLVKILEENGKPVEERSFSLSRVTPAQDADYMRAVESGDMAKAQAMVDEAAKSSKGRLMITLLPRDMKEQLFNEYASFVNPEAKQVIFNTKKVPYGEMDIRGILVDDIPASQLQPMSATSKVPPLVIADGKLIDGQHRINSARQIGRTSLPYIDVTGLTDIDQAGFISTIPAVTRDESGQVIPLSQRFNPADDRITFSLSPSKQGASVGSMASQDQAAQTPSSSPGGLTEAEAKQYEAGRNRFGDLHPDKAADLWEALANDGVAFEFEGTWVLANPELQGIPSQIAVYGKSKLSSRAEKAYATKLFKSDLVPSVEAGVAAIRRVPTIRVSEFEMDGLNHQAASLPGPFHGDIRKLQKWSVPESELDALRSAPNSLVRDEIMGRLLEVYEPPQLKDYSHLSAADFEEMVRERLPSMPVEKVKLAVASSMRSRGMDWSDLKGSEFDVVAAIVRPFVRHEMTAYDQLLRNGAPKDEARSLVLDNVEATIEQWSRPNNEAAKVSQGGFNKGSDSSPGSLLETTSKPMPEATMVGGQWPNDNSPSPPTVNSFNPSASTAEAYNMKRADWVSKNPFPDGENEHETVRHTLAMWAAIGVNPAKYSPHPYISKIEIGRHKGSSKSDSTYFDLIASIKDGVDVSSIGDRYDEEAREVLQTVRLSDHPRPASSPFPADINLVVENGNWLDALNESIQKFSEVIESEAKQQTPTVSSEGSSPVGLPALQQGADQNLLNDSTSPPTVNSFNSSAPSLGASFSISPARNLELVQSAIDSQLSRDPDKRLKLAASAMQKLEALRSRWMEEGWTALGHYKRPLVEKRGKASLDKEQSMRQATRERELLDLGMNSLSQQEAETYFNGLMKLEEHPLVFAMLNDNGRLMSKTTAEAQGKLKTDGVGNAGDYNSVPWLPPSWYRNGGGIMPSEMAQALYDDGKLKDTTPDALWSALSSVIESHRKNKAAFAEAEAAVKVIEKAAKDQARAEAQTWRDDYDVRQSKDWNPRAALVRDLQLLDSVLSVLPPEVRAKVGGFVKLAQLATEDARVKELQRRVSRMDTLLEDYLANEYRERIDKLLDKAAPKMKPGEKPKGSMAADAHRLVKLVRESMSVSEDAMDERRAAIEKAMAEDAANMPDLLERAQVLEMFGGFDKLPASELAIAHDWLDGVVKSGRNRWKMVEEARLAEQQARAKALKDDTGKSGDPVELQNAIEAEKTIAKTGVGLGFSLISFPQTVRSLFGDKSQAGQRLIDMARRATSARTDAIIQRRAEFKAAMRSIFGTTDQAKIDAAMWEHSQVTGKLGVTVKWSELTTKSERVPRDVVERMMEDRSIAKALGFTTNEVDELERAWLDSENDGKSVFILDRMTEGPAKDLNLSQMQAIHLLMMATQKPEALARHGYTADVLDEIESKLTNEAKLIRAWLLGRYRDGYQPLNAVFQRMYGAPLPQISGYSPMTFEGMQDGGMLTPEGGSQGFGGMSPGALKTRRNHNAKPRLEDALAVYWSHAIQTEHFIHFAEPVRDMRSTLLQPDTRAAVQVKAGVEGLNALKNWVHIFENDGMRKAGALTAIERLSSKLQSAVSVSALAWNVGTMVKQSLAALGALYKMPTRAYLRGLSRVLSGKIDIRPMFESAIIRRRVEAGATPELRQVMAGYMAEHPGKWSRRPREFVNYGMELLGKTDGFFTAISAAIYHDHISNEMKASGMGEAEASALAMRETEAMIGDTAQPVELMDRSLFEAGNAASPNARWLFMFASESRQKTALYGVALHRIATGRGTKQDARIMLVSHVIAPLILQTITNIIRDARSDDDDEAFDMETWSPMRYLQAMAMGPLSGLPLIQEASNPMLDMIQRSYYGIKGLFDDRKDAEPIEKGTKAAKAALNAVSLASIFPGLKPLEWLGAGANGVGQLFDWLDNLQGKDKRSGK